MGVRATLELDHIGLEDSVFDAGRFKTDFSKNIFEKVDSEKVIFELPGYWIKGITESHVYQLECWLIDNQR